MKKVIAVLCLCGLIGLTAGLPLSPAAAEKVQTAQNGGTPVSGQVTYPEYCRNTGSVPSSPGEKLSLYAADCAKITGDNISLENSSDHEGGKIIRWVSSEKDSSVLWRFNVSKGARYRLKISYCALESSSSISLGLKINGEYPFTACQDVGLYKIWKNETDDFVVDSAGNEKRPAAVQVIKWQEAFLSDSEGVSNEPYEFAFFEGENTIELIGISTDLLISSITLEGEEEPESYESYSAAVSGGKNADKADSVIVQGEKMKYRSDSSIVPMEDRSHAETMPSDPVLTRYNTVGDYNWQTEGQWIYWEFEIKTEGYYNIGMRVRQNYHRGYASSRKIYIDGVVPFKELSQVDFNYARSWYFKTLGNGVKDYGFYFTKGVHSIAMQVIPGDTAELTEALQDSVLQLNRIYRSVIMITGTSPDAYRDYNLDKEIPDLIEDMTKQRDILKEQYDALQKKYGGRDSDTATLQRLVAQLGGYIEDADKITESISGFSDNISSLSSLVVRLKEQPLELDYIEVKPANGEYTDTSVGFFKNIAFGFRQFIGSFTTDYNSVGDTAADAEKIDVWVSISRDQAQVVRELVDNDFSKSNNVAVQIKLSKGSLIQATYAGTGPDVALYIAADQPVNLAVRGALAELSEFEGCDELLKEFSYEETVGFRYNGGLYGIPMTADMNMMFVRTDIFEELGLSIPETWEELYKLIPTLQRSNMNIGLPKVTIDGGGFCVFNSLLLQNGQNYYNDDISAAVFDSETALDAFKEWTGYYTKYDVPIDYDFYNRFRSGEIPIGIEAYTMYNKLAVAAPEISGMWTMVPVPGTARENGSVDHSTAVSCTAAVIMNNCKNKQAAWKFVKWFASAKSQAEYGRNMEALIGESARYNSANLAAVPELPWTMRESSVILKQLNAAKGIPQSIASYYVTRNIYNAYRKVTVNNSNPREVLYKYNTEINNELERKREEFGLKGENGK